jgi:catechol 2,3-dioxygenase-like lactoylglutathione lyase family enzyme
MGSGIHHIGVATHDMDATMAFYEDVLGFPAVVCETIELEAGGTIRHAFFDTGGGELIAFMEPNEVGGIDQDFDASINRGLGTGSGMYHFAFRVRDEAELETRRADLLNSGLKVRGIVDHGWCKSIYFRDPNYLQLEFCYLSQELTPAHVAGRDTEAWRRLARS